jgi:uncharacterized protein YgbK (DUF1537 family)
LKIGVIADDFTGASDIALTLAEAGMGTIQFVGVPRDAAADCDAGVVSLKSRTSPLAEAIHQSLAACDWLIAQGAEQIVFKICSTFDSSDDGNIGQVAEALAGRLGERSVLVCPASPENGRTVYQGHLFVGDKLLNESGMENHPLTPMKDSDLRRVLAKQTRWPVGHIASRIVSQGSAAITARLETLNKMYIIDAINDTDLRTIGSAAAGRKLVCGGSGIATGLPENFGFTTVVPFWSGVPGRGVILSGSCSIATRRQIDRYKQSAPSLELAAQAVMHGEHTPQTISDWIFAQDHDAPLVYSSADPATVVAAQNEFGKREIAEKIEDIFQNLATLLVERGVSQIVSAGGETSGAVVAGLSAKALRIGRKIAAGVPALYMDDRALAIALKSGNFGEEDFFQKAINILSGRE